MLEEKKYEVSEKKISVVNVDVKRLKMADLASILSEIFSRGSKQRNLYCSGSDYGQLNKLFSELCPEKKRPFYETSYGNVMIVSRYKSVDGGKMLFVDPIDLPIISIY